MKFLGLLYISLTIYSVMAIYNFDHFSGEHFNEIIVCADNYLNYYYEYLLSKSSEIRTLTFCRCGDIFSEDVFNARSLRRDDSFYPMKIILKIENVTTLQNYLLLVQTALQENIQLVQHLYIFIWPFIITIPENSEQELQKFISSIPTSASRFSFASNVIFEVSSTKCLHCNISTEFWEYYTFGNMTVINKVENIYIPLMKRRNTLKGIPIKAVAQYDDDFKFELDLEVKNNSIRYIGGTAVSIFNDLIYSLNFTAVSVIGKGWISQNSNGTLTGIGQQVISEETDLSISLSAMTLYRAQHLSFIQPVTSDRYHAVFRQPAVHHDIDIILSPFSDTVWTEIAILCVAIIVILFITTQLHNFFRIYGEIKEKSEALTYIIGTLCQQSWGPRPGANSETIAVICFLLGNVFLYALYSAAVVSSFSVVIVPIKDFHELLHSHYIPLIRPSIPIYASVVDDEETVNQLVDESKIHYESESISVQRVMDSQPNAEHSFAHVSYLSTFYSIGRNLNYTNTQLCSVSAVPLGNVRYKNAMFVRKRDEFLEIFNLKTITIMQSGLNSRYYKIFLKEVYVQCQIYHEKSAFRELTIQDYKTVYNIIYVGFSVAVIILIVELILHTRDVMRRKKRFKNYYCI